MQIFKPTITKVLSILIIASLGWLIKVAIELKHIPHQIGYVAKDEILKLEKERVVEKGEESLFKGNENAPEMITKIGINLENDDLSVIFSASSVGGTNVFSLSKKVHEEVIRQLEQQGEDKIIGEKK